MKKILTILIILMISCKSNHAFIYEPSNEKSKSKMNKILAILPFKDSRGNENNNYFLLTLIPLIPYASKNLDQPENDQSAYLFRPKSDLPNAFISEFESKQMFKEIIIFFPEMKD